MAKRRKNEIDGLEVVIALMLTSIIFLFKWFIEGIMAIINFINKRSKKISRKKLEKDVEKQISDIFNDTYQDLLIKPQPNISIKEIKEKLNTFDKTIYNNLSKPQIIERGIQYFIQNKIQDLNKQDNKYTAIVKGTNDYNVSITFSNDDILSATCNCPYYEDKKEYCKHIYSVLYNVKCKDNLLIINNILQEYITKEKEIIYKFKNSKVKFNNKNSILNHYEEKFKIYTRNIEKYSIDEDTLLHLLNLIIQDSYYLELELKNKKTIAEETKDKSYQKNIQKQSNSNISFFKTMKSMMRTEEEKQKDYEEKLEKEMDKYALFDYERELVRKGEFEPYDFSEEEPLTEDDYYYYK